jgi:hypothetical protein
MAEQPAQVAREQGQAMSAVIEDVYTQIETRELARLRAIENAAMRVASSRRVTLRDDGGTVGLVVHDQRALDALDMALEAR